MTSLTHWLLHNKHRVRTILFVFAHPDDEILCSGGLLQWAMAHKFIPHVVILTQGEKGNHRIKKNKTETAHIRKKEFAYVMDTLHINNATMLTYPDGGLVKKQTVLTKAIETVCAKAKISCLVTHDILDTKGHTDHMAVARCCQDVASRRKIPVLFSLSPYERKEVEGDMRQYAIHLTKFMIKRNMELLKLYTSQFTPEFLARLSIRQQFFPHESYGHIV